MSDSSSSTVGDRPVVIEIVPFPGDPDDRPVVLGGPEPEPAPDVVEPEAAETEPTPEVAETEPTTEAAAPTATAPTATSSARVIPVSAASSSERRSAGATPSAPATPAGSLRRMSVVTRVVLVALLGVIAAAVIAGVSAWGIAETSSATRSVATLGDAEQLNDELVAELQALAASNPDQTAGHAQRIVDLSARVAALTDVDLGADADAKAADAQRRLLATGTATKDPALIESALVARTEFGARIAGRQRQLLHHASSVRTTAIVLVMVLLALASTLLVVAARRIGRSITDPVRLLGRNIRRFGDGDTSVRAAVDVDEVGTLARSFNSMADQVGARVQQLHDHAERGARLRIISDALDQADHESDVHHIVEGALGLLLPDRGGELLLNDSTSSTLWRVATNPEAGPANCPVENTSACVAMRRAQPMTWDSPDDINACPKLRGRDTGPCSAACVPVGVNGNLLGVLHVTGPEHERPDDETVDQLMVLAGLLGTRIGSMRTLESTRLQASTDGLTGLPNRRMLESRLGDLLRTHTPFVLAVADLDKFKDLNTFYGLEFGDRALQLFAKVLESNIRGHDFVARFGGEEFVLVYPEMSVAQSTEVMDRIRTALARALDTANFPSFTCSFGVTHSTVADSADAIIRVADAGLHMAKELGRNRVVYADEDLAAEVFGAAGNGAPPVPPVEPAGDGT